MQPRAGLCRLPYAEEAGSRRSALGVHGSRHSASRPPRQPRAPSASWFSSAVGKRGTANYGLAYAGVAGFEKQAIEYLERAPQKDAEVLAHLAYLYETRATGRRRRDCMRRRSSSIRPRLPPQ